MALPVLTIVVLVVAVVFIAIGTGLIWNNAANQQVNDNEYGNYQYNWDVTQFWIVWTFSIGAVVLQQKILAAFAGGVAVYLAIWDANNWASFASINNCRVVDQENSLYTSRMCTAGGIFAYTGLILSLGAAFGPYKVPSGAIEKVLALLSIVFTIVGCIVLWTSTEAKNIDYIWGAKGYNVVTYTRTIDITILTILATWYVVAGLSTDEKQFILPAGVLLAGFTFNYVFHNMFDIIIKRSFDEGIAGSLFCWFAQFTNVAIGLKVYWASKGSTAPSA